jgi:hypothetical protein
LTGRSESEPVTTPKSALPAGSGWWGISRVPSRFLLSAKASVVGEVTG